MNTRYDASSEAYDAIVVAGGRGTRLGGTRPGDKAVIELGGRPLIEHVLGSLTGADRVICVAAGLPDDLPGRPLRCVERPVGAGPLAAVAAGVDHVTAGVVVVVAGDAPFVGGAVPALRDALADGVADVAVLTDHGGRRHYLAAVWHTPALRAALDSLGAVTGRPMRSLYDVAELDVFGVLDTDGCAFDVDTPDDLAAAHRRLYG